jgi:hypothetical protein
MAKNICNIQSIIHPYGYLLSLIIVINSITVNAQNNAANEKDSIEIELISKSAYLKEIGMPIFNINNFDCSINFSKDTLIITLQPEIKTVIMREKSCVYIDYISTKHSTSQKLKIPNYGISRFDWLKLKLDDMITFSFVQQHRNMNTFKLYLVSKNN